MTGSKETHMRRIASFTCAWLVLGAALLAAQSGAKRAEDRLAGDWNGTWDGGSTGKYSMTIAREAGKLTGNLSVSPDGGEGYKVAFKSIAVDGPKVQLRYDAPGGEAEVVLDGTVDGKTLKGTWQALDGGKNVLDSGTFTGTKS
jgi:hypothetical protein